MRVRSLWVLVREASLAWMNSDVFRLSASLSYFTVFSLAPLLIVVLFVVGLFWQDQSGGAQARILAEIGALTGPDGAEMIRVMLDNAERPGSGGVVATIVGVGAMLFGATAVFVQIQGALNTIWGIQPRAASVKRFFLMRALSFGLILAVGFLLLVSLVVSAALAAADEFITGLAPGLQVLGHVLNTLLAFGVIIVLFAMIYRFLPDTDLAWSDVWVGAISTALLFNVGKLAISLYLGNSSVTSTYGAAGSLAVLLLWIYYSALVFFFGAEVTQAYVKHYGRSVRRRRRSPVA